MTDEEEEGEVDLIAKFAKMILVHHSLRGEHEEPLEEETEILDNAPLNDNEKVSCFFSLNKKII